MEAQERFPSPLSLSLSLSSLLNDTMTKQPGVFVWKGTRRRGHDKCLRGSGSMTKAVTVALVDCERECYVQKNESLFFWPECRYATFQFICSCEAGKWRSNLTISKDNNTQAPDSGSVFD